MLSSSYGRLKKYIHNILWVMGDKVLTLAVGFLVTVVVARYLGPTDFGMLTYALSLSALFGAAGHMGLSGLVVREIVRKPELRGETLGTAYGLKLIGMIVGYASLLIYAGIYEGSDSLEFYMVAIAGASLLFTPVDVIDFWFQALVKSRYTTIARITALLFSSGVKLYLVLMGAGVLFFSAASLIQAMVAAVMLVIIYKIRGELKLSIWRFDKVRARELLSQGWIVYLGSIFAVIYLKIDQVMLRWYSGVEEVGIYSVAAQLSEAWYFVPTAIVASFFPKLIKLKDESSELFYKRLQQLFDVLFLLALLVAIFMTFISERLVLLFFGESYIESANILVIHTWAAIFIFMRAAFSKWILIEGALFFSLLTQGAGAVINVALNYFLIPVYNGKGAAIATLISYAVASFFSLILYKKTRKVFWLMTKSFFAPLRYGNKLIQRGAC